MRRRNIVPPDKMPYATGLTARSGASITYDSGDFPRMMETVLAAIDHAGFAGRQKVSFDTQEDRRTDKSAVGSIRLVAE